jgi:serine/threonine protein kinase
LRPLRFREKFNPTRLRREVDIMRRLKHPNIIQFVDVFETPEYLMVVMEYAPGRELFDVRMERIILSRSGLSLPLLGYFGKEIFHRTRCSTDFSTSRERFKSSP